jgi:hypothetical protein
MTLDSNRTICAKYGGDAFKDVMMGQSDYFYSTCYEAEWGGIQYFPRDLDLCPITSIFWWYWRDYDTDEAWI